MAAQAGLANSKGTALPELAGEVRYVARQPILDLQGRVHGYDLLFRNAPEVMLHRDAELAVQTMLDNEVIFGLERLTNGLPAFITCTAEALTENSVLVLSPALTVLGVPASLETGPRLVEACQALKTRGFRLALDDFAWQDSPHPLLNQADYVRLDFARFREAEKQQISQGGFEFGGDGGAKGGDLPGPSQGLLDGLHPFPGRLLLPPSPLEEAQGSRQWAGAL